MRKFETERNAIAKHVSTTDARPLWNETKILAREDNWYQRRVKEALWIERRGSINRNHGLEDVMLTWQPSSHHK